MSSSGADTDGMAEPPPSSLNAFHGSVRVLVREDATVVALRGEHDLATLEPVKAAVDAAVAGGGAVIIDLSQCEFLDCRIVHAFPNSDTTTIVVGPETPTVVSRLLDLMERSFSKLPSQSPATADGR